MKLNVLFSVSSDWLYAAFPANVLSLSFTQGEEGDQGSPGEVGSQGPVVREHIYYMILVFQVTVCSLLRQIFLLTDAPVACLLFQGPQGIRGAMGMMGPKGEMVSVPVILKSMVPARFFQN